jgi:hypothetical protein
MLTAYRIPARAHKDPTLLDGHCVDVPILQQVAADAFLHAAAEQRRAAG